MSSLTAEQKAILRMFQKDITKMPDRESLRKYQQQTYTPWTLVDNEKKNPVVIKSKKKSDGYDKLGDGYKGFMMAHLLKPSHSGLTIDELEKAQLARASRMFYEKGLGTAEQYLLQNKNPYKIDGELSNNEGLVVTKNGKPEMAFRGTDKTNFKDLQTDAAILIGREAETEQFENADNQIQNVKNKYGMLPEHYTGFSLGGAKSLHFGQKYNTPTTNLNPFMGKNLTNNISNTSALQQVIRTTNDPASIGLALSDNATHPSWRIKSILPLKKNTLNPITTHHLDNFTNEDNLERTYDNALNHMEKHADTGFKLAEYKDLNTAVEAVNEGKTYAQWLYEEQTSKADSYIKQDGTYGLKGSRHIPKAKGMRAWHDAGGSFTGEEAVYINKLMNNVIPSQTQVSNEIIGGGEMTQGVPNIGPPEPPLEKTQKYESKFKSDKFTSPILPETKLKMLMAKGGMPPIKEDGTITGLYGEQKFIEPNKRADYNRMRELFNKAQGITKDTQFQQNISSRMKRLTDTTKSPLITEEEINQRNDIIDNAIENAHKNNKYGLSKVERDTFVIEDSDDRKNIIEDTQNQFNSDGERAQGMLDGMEATGVVDNFMTSMHPTNLVTGLLAGAATEKISKFTGINTMPMIPRDLVKGAITGAISEKFASGLTGASMTGKGLALNMGAGAVSYVVGDVSKIGIKAGLDKLGANKDTQESLSDIGSGGLSGATYGAIVGGPEGGLIGGGIGLVGGAAEYGLEKAGASSKTAKEVEKAVDYGLSGAGIGAGIGSVIPGIGTAVGSGIGFLVGETAYGLSKIF